MKRKARASPRATKLNRNHHWCASSWRICRREKYALPVTSTTGDRRQPRWFRRAVGNGPKNYGFSLESTNTASWWTANGQQTRRPLALSQTRSAIWTHCWRCHPTQWRRSDQTFACKPEWVASTGETTDHPTAGRRLPLAFFETSLIWWLTLCSNASTATSRWMYVFPAVHCITKRLFMPSWRRSGRFRRRHRAPCNLNHTRGSENRLIEIRLKRNEPVEKSLRRLKKLMLREGVFLELKKRRHYEKPSVTLRRKRKAAQFEAMLKQRHADD